MASFCYNENAVSLYIFLTPTTDLFVEILLFPCSFGFPEGAAGLADGSTAAAAFAGSAPQIAQLAHEAPLAANYTGLEKRRVM